MSGAVYLDMRQGREKRTGSREPVDWKQRFPGISKFLEGYGLELARDLIPVRPAAHYLMGGIRTDVHGRTSLPGLYAAGEAACTGVHGANRLASNSLLEGLVFGARAAETMVEEQVSVVSPQMSVENEGAENGNERGDIETWVSELRGLMWKDAGLLRDGVGLRRAQERLTEMREGFGAAEPGESGRRALEARNLHMVAEVMVQAALGRKESRGAHFRKDFPGKADVARHSIVKRGRLIFVDEAI
jgi:L-aspartate oxidase